MRNQTPLCTVRYLTRIDRAGQLLAGKECIGARWRRRLPRRHAPAVTLHTPIADSPRRQFIHGRARATTRCNNDVQAQPRALVLLPTMPALPLLVLNLGSIGAVHASGLVPWCAQIRSTVHRLFIASQAHQISHPCPHAGFPPFLFVAQNKVKAGFFLILIQHT